MIDVVIPMILTHLDNQPRDGVQRLSSRLVKYLKRRRVYAIRT